MKTYTINWIAEVSGLASVEAESEAEAISKFNAEAGCYIHLWIMRKVDSIEEEEES